MSSYPNHTPPASPSSTDDDPIREGIELIAMMPDAFLRAIVAGEIDVQQIATEIVACIDDAERMAKEARA